MAALTKDRDTKRRTGIDFNFPVAAGVRIFTGAVVCLNAAGFAAPATATAGLKFPAVARAGVDNRDGADGEASVDVLREVVGLDMASDVDRTVIGAIVYLEDDHTVTAASAGRSPAGLLVDVAEGQAWVDPTALKD